MADIKYLVEVDATGAVKSVKSFDGVLDDLKKKSGETETAHKSLWKQVALGEAAWNVAKKAGSLFIDFLKGSAKAAIDAERSQKSLEAALLSTDRPVEELGKHYSDYADQLMRSTIYDDEAIKGTQALLLQLTDLDREGIDKATKGAIGLASVMGIDLESAAQVIAKSMSGNTALLSRYGIHVRETGTAEEKRADALDKLAVFYQRAQKDTETYGGKLATLKRTYSEVQEAVGKLVTNNVALMDGLNKVAEGILYLANANDMLASQDAVIRASENRRIEWLSKAAVAAGWQYGEMGRLIVQQGNSAAATMRLINTDEKYAKTKIELQKAVQADRIAFEADAAARKKAEQGNLAGIEVDQKAIDAKKKLADAAQEIIKRGTPLTTALHKIRSEQELLNKAMKAGVIDGKGLATGTANLGDEYARLVSPVASADNALLKLAMDAKSKVIPGFQATAAEAKKAAAITKKSWVDAAKDWVNANQDAFNKTFEMARTITAGIDAIAQQSTNNKMLLLDKEYQAKLENIKKSTLSEEEKNAAITALDAEYEMKRRGVQRKAAESAKATAIANAIISTAEGMAKALGQGGIYGIVLAAIVAAFGAIQIAKIRAQPIPLATGAIFKKPVFSPDGNYQAGDAGPEAVIPIKELPRMLRELGSGRDRMGGGNKTYRLTIPIYLGTRLIKQEIVNFTEEAGDLGRLRLAGKAVG